jgi:PIN domain nuclease of toxin-antitoxin system
MPITRVQDFDINLVPKDKKFVLDANILYFVHSGYYLPTARKSVIYSNLIQQIISNDNTVLVSAISLQELLFGVENKEYDKYCRANNIVDKKAYSKKAFRRDIAERARVQSKMKTILAEITGIYEMIDGEIKNSQVNVFVDELLKYKYDPIDYILVDNLLDQNDVVFISDDLDFQSDARIEIITA